MESQVHRDQWAKTGIEDAQELQVPMAILAGQAPQVIGGQSDHLAHRVVEEDQDHLVPQDQWVHEAKMEYEAVWWGQQEQLDLQDQEVLLQYGPTGEDLQASKVQLVHLEGMETQDRLDPGVQWVEWVTKVHWVHQDSKEQQVNKETKGNQVKMDEVAAQQAQPDQRVQQGHTWAQQAKQVSEALQDSQVQGGHLVQEVNQAP